MISGLVRCIDDTNIPIIAPAENEPDYSFEWEDADGRVEDI